jgi:hypothetical protein
LKGISSPLDRPISSHGNKKKGPLMKKILKKNVSHAAKEDGGLRFLSVPQIT